jgi:hypothetical protein
MTPRRLPLPLDPVSIQRVSRSEVETGVSSVGFLRTLFALALHAGGLALFYTIVVMPVASPVATGELAREFKPLVDALIAWSAAIR